MAGGGGGEDRRCCGVSVQEFQLGLHSKNGRCRLGFVARTRGQSFLLCNSTDFGDRLVVAAG